MPSARHRRGFRTWHLLPAGLQVPSPSWGWGRRCGGWGSVSPAGRVTGEGGTLACSAGNLALLPPGVPESTSCMEMCGSYFSIAIRHVSGQQDSGVFSVPAFWSLGSRQGSRECVGLMDTMAAWPEACNVLESKRSRWPLVKCGRRFLFLWQNHHHCLLIN